VTKNQIKNPEVQQKFDEHIFVF